MLTGYIVMRSRLARDQDGASMVEYALLLVLIAIVVIAGAILLGDALGTRFSEFGSTVDNA